MKNKKSIAILMAAITLASCQSYKKVPYLQSYKSLTDKSYKEIVINEVNQQDTLYDAHIQPKDLLNITINTTDPQAAAPFNLTMQTYNNIAQSNASTTSQPALQDCGAHFVAGSKKALRCPECRKKAKRESNRLCAQRRKNGTARRLGEAYSCADCGKPFILKNGFQKYCPDCEPKHAIQSWKEYKEKYAKK